MGAYWRRFNPHGFLDYSIDLECITPRLAGNEVRAVQASRGGLSSTASRAFHLPVKEQNRGSYTRGKLTMKAIMSTVISISQTIMSGKEK